MPDLTTTWVLTDGKPGHENQSLGLANALARLSSCAIHTIPVHPSDGFFRRIRNTSRTASQLPQPDLILAAGHATHPSLCWLARKTHARSVVLMRPSLPLCCFDLCIAPSHDFPNGSSHPRTLLTLGALNAVLPPASPSRHGSLILLGGPSATHAWDTPALLTQIRALLAANPTDPWSLTNSRRSPAGLLTEIHQNFPSIRLFPHQETPRNWLPAQLAAAETVWVTEDSVSMVYEALSSGAKVGILEVPRMKPSARVLRGLAQLLADGYATPFSQWQLHHQTPPPPHPLREADRCAALVLERFFPPNPSP